MLRHYSVINNIKEALPKMKEALGADGEGIVVRFEFDHLLCDTRSWWSGLRRIAGGILVGLIDPAFFTRLAKLADCGVEHNNSRYFCIDRCLVDHGLDDQLNDIRRLGTSHHGILVDEATVSIEIIFTRIYSEASHWRVQFEMDHLKRSLCPIAGHVMYSCSVCLVVLYAKRSASIILYRSRWRLAFNDRFVSTLKYFRASDVCMVAEKQSRSQERY